MKKLFSLGLMILLALVTLIGCSSSNATTAEENTEGTKVSDEENTITISVRKNEWGGRAHAFEEAEVLLNEELKAKGENTEVVIDWWPAIDDNELVLQGQAGKKADVFFNSSVDIGWESEAGLIQPIDWVGESEVFKNSSDQIKNIMKFDGQYWGVIQDMDASPVFISKKALEGLGWSAEEIDGVKRKSR